MRYLIAVLALSFLTCSSQTVSDARESSEKPSANELRRRFRNSPPVEKATIAKELVAMGEAENKHLSYLREQAQAAIENERVIASSGRFVAGAWVARSHAVEPTVANASNPAGSEKLLRSNSGGTEKNFDTWRARSINLNDVEAVSNLAISGDPRGRDQLVDALTTATFSGNVLVASSAALGLANLKDYSSIPKIAAAGVIFPGEEYLFARALVYFGRADADKFAATLLRDAEVMSELRANAKAAAFKPYGKDASQK